MIQCNECKGWIEELGELPMDNPCTCHKSPKPEEANADEQISSVVRSGETSIDNIGGIVASETHGISSWVGYTEKMWAKFNVDPKSVPIAYLRKCLVEVRPIKEARPEGFIWIIAGVKNK